MKNNNFCGIIGMLIAAVMQPVLSVGQPSLSTVQSVSSNKDGYKIPLDVAERAKINQWMQNSRGLRFLENKGQMTDANHQPVKDLLFRASGGGVDMYVTTNGLSYVFTNTNLHKKPIGDPKAGDTKDKVTQQFCRADMELVGANIQKENIVKEDESSEYNNYYIGSPKGILNVHSYERITIKNIYPGIDWVLYTAKGADKVATGKAGLQYDFVVHPGADASLIKIRYKCPPVPGRTGADQPEMQYDGSMKISLPVGDIKEGTPVTHSIDGIDNIHTQYTLQNGEVGFALANYDKNKTVVIDPPLTWGTYYGGSGTDQYNSVWSDGTHVYVLGSTTSTNYPNTTNPGSPAYFQGSLGAGTNMTISEFTTAGIPVWVTYYGGSSSGESDNPEGISGDANNIWIDASIQATSISTTFPLTNPNNYSWYQTTSDIYWNPPVGTTYSSYVGGSTLSTGTSSYSLTGGSQFMVGEFNKTTGQVEYATYLTGISGNQTDQTRAIFDDGTHVWVSGYETSTSFPTVFQSGYYHNLATYNSGVIVEFNAVTNGGQQAGNLIWSTPIQSSSNSNGSICLGLTSDGTNVYISGLMEGNSGGLALLNPGGGAFYETTYTYANYAGFIMEFNCSTGAEVWGTFIGGNGSEGSISSARSEFVTNLSTDGTHLWASGYTGSSNLASIGNTTLMPNPGGGAYYVSTNTVSGVRPFIVEFGLNSTPSLGCNVPVWGTYYGGTTSGETDEVGGLWKDTKGNVWVCGPTNSATFPTMQSATAGYYQSSLGSASQTGWITEFNTSGVRQWSTYLGGTTSGESDVMGGQGGTEIFSTGSNVYAVGGSTGSTTFPTANPGGSTYYQSANGGGEDGFIADFSLLSVTASPTTEVSCNGGDNGVATASTVGGAYPYSYSWSPSGGTSVGGTTASATGLSAGTYTVTVTSEGSSATASVTITQPGTSVSATMGSPTNLTCYGTITGSATVTPGGGVSPYTYAWFPSGGNGATGNNLNAGTFTVAVTDNNGCTATASVTITQPAAIILSTDSTAASGCSSASGTASVTIVSGGVSPFTYLWNDPATQNTSTATGLSAGNYTVTVTDANNCSSTANVAVLNATGLNITGTSVTNETCNGDATGSASITLSGGTTPYTYSWSNGTTGNTAGSTVSASGLVANIYTVTVQDNGGCTSTASVTITQPAAISDAFASTVNETCNGAGTGSAAVSVTGGISPYTYTWTPNVSNTAFGTGLSAGTYSVTVTDINSCSGTTATVTITQPTAIRDSLVTASSVTSEGCNGQTNGLITIGAKGGVSPYTYTWNPNITNTSSLSGLSAGTYSITVGDNNGCSGSTVVVTVTQPNPLNPNITPTNVICNRASTGSATANPTGGTSPYTYSWASGGGTTATLNSYLFSKTFSYEAAVQNWTVPAGITQVTMSITGAAGGGSLGGDGASFTGTYTVTPAHVISVVVGQQAANSNGGGGGGASWVYDSTITGAHTGTPTLSGLIAVAAGGGGESLESTAGGAGGTNLSTYLTTNGSGGNAAGGTGGKGGTGGGGSYGGGGGAGWTTSGAAGVEGAGGGQDWASYFTGGTAGYASGGGYGGGGGSSYGGGGGGGYNGGGGGTSYTNGGGGGGSYYNSVYGTVGTATATNAGNGSVTISYPASGLVAGTYSLTLTDANGCTTSATVTITQPGVLRDSISSVTEICGGGGNNGSATVGVKYGTSPYTYSWSAGEGTNVTANGLTAGTYTVTVHDNCTASATASVTISAPNALTTTASVTANVICYGSSTGNASATPSGGSVPYTYTWSNGTTTVSTSNPTGAVLSAGTYTVTVEDNCGSMATAAVTITQPNPLSTGATALSNACNGSSNGNASATPSGGTSPYTYSWSNGSTSNPTGAILSGGTYTVTIEDHCGATATASAIIIQDPILLASTSVTNNVICNGTATGSAQATPSGGASPYTYSWSSGGGTNSTINSYAVSKTFSYEAAIQHYSVPAGVTQVTISIAGAQGGGVVDGSTSPADSGGYGASFTGVVPVTSGHILSVVVGQAGGGVTAAGSGGGGASWVYDSNTLGTNAPSGANGLLAVAAGGGGESGESSGRSRSGGAGGTNLSTNATTTSSSYSGAATGGTGGNGGGAVNGDNAAAGGGGWLSNGTYYIVNSDDYPGGDEVNKFAIPIANSGAGYGAAGTGGYGGGADGGAAGATGIGGGGGGGGYNGGVGGAGGNQGGGGGGSYLSSYPSGLISGPVATNTGNGIVTISYGNNSGLAAGTYTVTVTDNNGCTTTASVTLTQPNPLTASAVQATASCHGESTGTATATPSGGTIPYTYSWSGGGGTNSTGSNLSAGTYTVTVNDNCGATATASVTVTQPNALSATASAPNITCYGNTVTATASPSNGTSPYTYSWSGGGGTNSTASGLSAGTYTVTVQDNCNATATASVTITQPNALSATASQTAASYPGESIGSAIANPSGGNSPYTYSWSPYGGTNSSASGLSAGVYIITVQDNCGASATASVTITQPSSLSTGITILSDAGCSGGTIGNLSATPSGGAAPYTYSWSNGSTSNPTGATLSAGTYTVTVEDNFGSLARASATIHQSLAIVPTAFAATNVSCYGLSNGVAKVSLTGGKAPFVYSWSNGGSTYIASGLSAGTYSVTITDSNNCSNTAAVTITQPTLLKDSLASITYPQCNGTVSNATIGVTGGTSPYRYSWSPNVSTTATAAGLTVRSYVVQVKDNNGCYNNLNFSISQPAALRDSIVKSATVNVSCSGGSATVGVKYGTSPYTYSWSSGGGSNANATGLSAGTYIVTINDAGGCTVTTSVSIGQPSTLSATAFAGTNISCNGGANGVVKASVSGGTSPYIYSWSPGSNSTYIASGLSVGTYTVTVSDNCGASATSLVALTQPASLRDSLATISYPLCTGGTGSATIGVSGGTSPYKYTWSPNVSTTASATGLTVRGYVVQVKDNNGCYNDINFSLTQPAALRDSIVKSATVNISCNGASAGSATAGVKYGTTPYTYSWSPAGGNSATAIGLSGGTYTVTVSDGGGCTVTASVNITQPAALSPTAFIGAGITCNGASNGTAKVSVSGGSIPYTYSWLSPASGSTYIASGLSAGTYTVTVMDKCGASASSSVAVTQPAILSDSVITSSVVSPPCSGGGTGSAAIGVAGGTSPYRYTWSPNVSTTDSASGLTVRGYVVQVKDKNGCYNNITVNVTCSSAPATATYKDPDSYREGTTCCPSSDNINLYPNPNTGQFTLSGLQQGMILEMYDYTGKLISTMTTTNESMQLNIFNQANGVYLIRILDKDGNLVGEKKVVKTQ